MSRAPGHPVHLKNSTKFFVPTRLAGLFVVYRYILPNILPSAQDFTPRKTTAQCESDQNHIQTNFMYVLYVCAASNKFNKNQSPLPLNRSTTRFPLQPLTLHRPHPRATEHNSGADEDPGRKCIPEDPNAGEQADEFADV